MLFRRELQIALVTMLASSGCHRVFGLFTEAEPATDAATGDGARFGELCGSGEIIGDEFTGTEPCKVWGATYGAGSIVQSGGALKITPGSSPATGCSTNMDAPFPQAVFAEVSAIVPGAQSYTVLGAGDFDSISATAGNLRYESVSGTALYAEITYNAQDMRWWAMRQVGGTREALYSADGASWTVFGMRAPTITASSTLNVLAGVAASAQGNEAAVFERALYCP